jgi:hypothetical protein
VPPNWGQRHHRETALTQDSIGYQGLSKFGRREAKQSEVAGGWGLGAGAHGGGAIEDGTRVQQADVRIA